MKPIDVFVPGRYPIESNNAYAVRTQKQDDFSNGLRRFFVPIVYDGYGVGKSSMALKSVADNFTDHRIVYIESVSGVDADSLKRRILKKLKAPTKIKKIVANTSLLEAEAGGKAKFSVLKMISLWFQGKARANRKREASETKHFEYSPLEDIEVIEQCDSRDTVLIFDELHKATDDFFTWLSQFIKKYSNFQAKRFKIALLGTSIDPTKLISRDFGIDRTISEVKLESFSSEESRDLIESGFAKLHFAIDQAEVDRITKLSVGFLYFITASPPFRRLGEASMTGAAGQKRVSEDFVRDFRIPVPPLSRQHAIADYLDHETARLDTLVAAKERLLGLLTEKRRALITRAVTRGLDPRAPLRDSGIPWLGEIPAHWETRRVAWLFRERDERGEPDLPLLEVSINAGVVLCEFSEERIESTASDFNTYKVARQGDVVFNKMRMWQGAVGVAPQDGLVSPDYVVAASTGPLTPQYAGLLFRTEMFSAECARRSHGIVWDRLRLYWEGFREIELPLPSADAQDDIVVHIAEQTAKLDELRAATERTTVLLKERRAAIVAAAVTGQIDVQEAIA